MLVVANFIDRGDSPTVPVVGRICASAFGIHGSWRLAGDLLTFKTSRAYSAK